MKSDFKPHLLLKHLFGIEIDNQIRFDDIYILQETSYPYRIKIGRSENIENRINQIKTSCPSQLEVIHIEIGYGAIENKIHKALKDAEYHEKGEWFKSYDTDTQNHLLSEFEKMLLNQKSNRYNSIISILKEYLPSLSNNFTLDKWRKIDYHQLLNFKNKDSNNIINNETSQIISNIPDSFEHKDNQLEFEIKTFW